MFREQYQGRKLGLVELLRANSTFYGNAPARTLRRVCANNNSFSFKGKLNGKDCLN